MRRTGVELRRLRRMSVRRRVELRLPGLCRSDPPKTRAAGIEVDEAGPDVEADAAGLGSTAWATA
jgi:hypothetical protein